MSPYREQDPPKKLFLISLSEENLSEIQETQLKGFFKQEETWWHHIPNVWFLHSSINYEELFERIASILGERKLIVIQIEIKSIAAYLPTKGFDWLASRLTR